MLVNGRNSTAGANHPSGCLSLSLSSLNSFCTGPHSSNLSYYHSLFPRPRVILLFQEVFSFLLFCSHSHLRPNKSLNFPLSFKFPGVKHVSRHDNGNLWERTLFIPLCSHWHEVKYRVTLHNYSVCMQRNGFKEIEKRCNCQNGQMQL